MYNSTYTDTHMHTHTNPTHTHTNRTTTSRVTGNSVELRHALCVLNNHKYIIGSTPFGGAEWQV